MEQKIEMEIKIRTAAEILEDGRVLLAARDVNNKYLILKRTERPATRFGGFPEIRCYSGR